MTTKTFGIIVIGDEILKGQVKDTNTVYACKKLNSIGINVAKISIIKDNIQEIADEVRLFSKVYDIVITSGGIGPTHDDVTYSGVALAFNQKTIPNKEMSRIVNNFFSNGALKMAVIPEKSQLLHITSKATTSSVTNGSSIESFPVVKVENVYVLPGIPECFKQSFDYLFNLFKQYSKKCYKTNLLITTNEVRIVESLNELQRKFCKVVFSSYPVTTNSSYNTKICLEGEDLEEVVEAYNNLKNTLPKKYLNSRPESTDVENVYDMKNGIESHCLAVSNSLKVIEEACNKYAADGWFLCFNGGKDCTVLLHLLWAVLQRRNHGQECKINTVYIRCQDPFPQVEQFIQTSCERYNLNLTTVDGPIKSALEQLTKDKPDMKAVFMGTRRTDPYSSYLGSFQMCDPEWPQVMRISPILDWSYQDVWTFLRLLDVDYCSLYDHGYTSLGNVRNTIPNPALRLKGNDFDPAYRLADGNLEREGRKP